MPDDLTPEQINREADQIIALYSNTYPKLANLTVHQTRYFYAALNKFIAQWQPPNVK